MLLLPAASPCCWYPWFIQSQWKRNWEVSVCLMFQLRFVHLYIYLLLLFSVTVLLLVNPSIYRDTALFRLSNSIPHHPWTEKTMAEHPFIFTLLSAFILLWCPSLCTVHCSADTPTTPHHTTLIEIPPWFRIRFAPSRSTLRIVCAQLLGHLLCVVIFEILCWDCVRRRTHTNTPLLALTLWPSLCTKRRVHDISTMYTKCCCCSSIPSSSPNPSIRPSVCPPIHGHTATDQIIFRRQTREFEGSASRKLSTPSIFAFPTTNSRSRRENSPSVKLVILFNAICDFSEIIDNYLIIKTHREWLRIIITKKLCARRSWWFNSQSAKVERNSEVGIEENIVEE